MSKKYKISAETRQITTNTTLLPENKYGGWMAVNQGATTAKVFGYELQPGEGIDFRDCVPVDAYWDTPIQIIPGTGGLVVITRLQVLKIA